jgi:hypothetical protein
VLSFLPSGSSTFYFAIFQETPHRFDFAHFLKRVESKERRQNILKAIELEEHFIENPLKAFEINYRLRKILFLKLQEFMQYSLGAVDKRKTVARGT